MSLMDLLIEVITVSRVSGKSSFCLVATVLGSKGGQALGIVFAFRLANCFTSGENLGHVEKSLKNRPPYLTSDYGCVIGKCEGWHWNQTCFIRSWSLEVWLCCPTLALKPSYPSCHCWKGRIQCGTVLGLSWLRDLTLLAQSTHWSSGQVGTWLWAGMC